MSSTWILRFGEIILKSRPVQKQFNRALFHNLHAIACKRGVSLKAERFGALYLVISDAEPEEVEQVLSRVLGIVAIDRVRIICDDNRPDQIAKFVLENDDRFGQKRTFGVQTKRLGTNYDWNSQSFSAAVGSEILQRDPSLSVDLSNPEMSVKLIIEPERVWLLGEKVSGVGGLPSGVQGDVLCMLKEEKDTLNSFLAMRRGCRLIPMEGSDQTAIDTLAEWDPFIGKPTDKSKKPTGVIGASIEDAEKYIAREEGNKIVPICSLDSLCAWTDSEISHLKKHIEQPLSNPKIMDIYAWVS